MKEIGTCTLYLQQSCMIIKEFQEEKCLYWLYLNDFSRELVKLELQRRI